MTESLETHLEELRSELEDSLDEPPELGHLLAVLTSGIQCLDPEALSRADPAAVESLIAGDVKPSSVDEANDASFTEGADLVADLVSELTGEKGSAPTLKQLLKALAAGLEVDKLEAVTAKKKGKRPKDGDVIAIPVGDDRYRLAVVLEHNRFGTAIGLFKGVYPLGGDIPADLEPERHAVHTGDYAVRDGRWPVVGHDDGLRSRFGRPEYYYRPNPERPEIGRYGSGETADGRMRDLDKEEAEELGLFNAVYHAVVEEDVLEDQLRAR